jgi:hypothetical protein
MTQMGVPRKCFPSTVNCKSPLGNKGMCLSAPSPKPLQAPIMQDASERKPGVQVHANASSHSGNALKFWLSGVGGEKPSLCDQDLAERLRAAAPESYED